MSLFWLRYRDGPRTVGVVITEASSLVVARVSVAMAGLDPGGQCEGLALDPRDRAKVPVDMTDRLLGADDLATLERIFARPQAVHDGA